MMRQLIGFSLFLFSLMCVLPISAQTHQAFSHQIQSVQVAVDGNPLLPPMLDMDKHQHVQISWDEMSHDYHRYIYHVQHCQYDWTPSDGIFESDYLSGLNDQPVEDYEKSFNTTQIYTHYQIRFPNPETGLLLSGNYKVLIYEDGGSKDEPILEARFSVFEKAVSIQTEVSSDTDIDFNKKHQQVSLNLNYGTLPIVDPHQQLHTVVMQNRRWDNRVVNPKANIRNNKGIAFTHCKDLIFPAGNEFHKFEILDVNRAAMGVDKMEWFEPYYHATLFAQVSGRNYRYDEDQNGVAVIRSEDDEDDATTAEYVLVHFILESERLPGGDVYVCGQWTNGAFDPSCRMKYDDIKKRYEAVVMLKQGYYSYQFVQENSATSRTMGDFYETENEYITLVYFRAQGARTDRLVGYSRVKTGSK